jgi:hypothetical protein
LGQEGFGCCFEKIDSLLFKWDMDIQKIFSAQFIFLKQTNYPSQK